MQKQFLVIAKAPIEKVFAALSELDKVKKWMRGSVRTKFKNLTNQENPVGVKFSQNFMGLMELDGEILSYDPPREFGMGLQSLGLKGTLFYNLQEIEAFETKLAINLEVFDGTAKAKILLQTFWPIYEKIIDSHLKSIVKLAEES